MKSRNFWAALCLFALFALPAVAQDWVQKQVIVLPEKCMESYKVVANNEFLFVAQPYRTPTDFTYKGAVQIYKKENDLWIHNGILTPVGNTSSFGQGISLDGEYLVVSSGTHLHIYQYQQNVWALQQTISVPLVQNEPANCYIFGFSRNIIIEGDYIYASTSYQGCSIGSAIHIYKKNASSTWEYKKRINMGISNNFGLFLQAKDGWLVTYNLENPIGALTGLCFYKIDDCLNNTNDNCSPTYFFSSFGYIHSYLPQDKGEHTFIGFESNLPLNPSNNPHFFKSYTLSNNVWKNTHTMMPPVSSTAQVIAYTDDVLLITPAISPFQGNLADIVDADIYMYKKLANTWIKSNVIKYSTIFPYTLFTQTHPLSIIDNNQFLANGFKVQNGDTLNTITYFQKTRGNIIKGKVYHDSNANCQKESGEAGKSYYIIKAEPGNYITSTDENGNYELEVGEGTYTISQEVPEAKGLQVTQLCPAGNGSHTVSFTGLNNEVSGYDFGNDVKECTFLTVDVTSRRRRCFRNQTTVKYENEGVAVANNAYITVTFPEYVIPLSSTNPWVSKEGNTYKFNVGTLQAGQRGQFVVTDSVACVPNIQGLIQCTEAKIYPKNTCSAPTWTGANLEISSQCLNVVPHKGRFVLRNTGTTSLNTTYKVWRGNTLILNNLLSLAQGDSLVLEIPTNGENLFLQANQAAGHPDGTVVSAMVMNCGNALPTSAGSPQVQMMIVPNDEYANSETDCMPIVDSYDPNDKAVSPAGITENNYVRPNTELEYKIRFQNMGTAEAVNIVVIDTLSQHLDLTTFQMMSASHTYKLKFERVNGKQVAFWTFTDINLPAKSINEPASHGYIKFKIKHLPTIAEGTIIKNFADIYFDFNEPVRTNETAINMTDYQFPVNPIDYCNLFAQAQAGQARTVCGNAYTLEGNLPTMGQGTWTRISGAGEIAEPHKPNSVVTDLGVGENVFRWTFTGVPDCANTQSQVTITRLPDASVSVTHNAPNNTICAEENITFTAQTNNVGNAPIYQWKVNGVNVGTNLPTFSSSTLQNQDKITLEIQTNLNCNNPPKVTSQAIEITVKPKPTKPTIAHTSLYELKSNVEGDSYTWYKDNTLLSNNLPTLKVDKLGKYKVVVSQNGCASPISDEFVLNANTLQKFADLSEVKLYPNPTTGKVILDIINNQGSAVDIQIYNNVGQLITEQRVEGSENIDCKVMVDLTAYPQGIYHAKITNQFGLQTLHKIVVQKQ